MIDGIKGNFKNMYKGDKGNFEGCGNTSSCGGRYRKLDMSEDSDMVKFFKGVLERRRENER